MLCSAVELGLSEQGEGLFNYQMLQWRIYLAYLKLADYIIDVAITPNRGDV